MDGDQEGQQGDAEGADPGEPPEDSARLTQDALASRPQPVQAHTYIRLYGSFSKPVALKCDDGNVYIVKARQPGRPEVTRAMVNEHIVARLGALLGAPVPDVALVQVPAELIAAQPEMQHMAPGLAHGSREVDNATDRAGIDHFRPNGNRPRFARLAVLYGWVGASDYQFIYQKTAPHSVYSVDHGHFFPGGLTWTLASIAQAPAAQPDPTLAQTCAFTRQEIEEAVQALATIDKKAIAEAVAGPPDEWGLTFDERVALLDFLVRRWGELLAAYPPNQQRGGTA